MPQLLTTDFFDRGTQRGPYYLRWCAIRLHFLERLLQYDRIMRSNVVYIFALMLPLVTYTACSSDDDNIQAAAGSGGTGTGQAGASGATSEAGTAGSGMAGEDESGGFGNGSGGTNGLGNNAGSGGDAGSTGAAARLTDAEILKVLVTANQGEIAAGQVAIPSAQSIAVSNFAQMMITDHTTANAQTLGLVSTEHIAPAASDVSENLDNEAAALLVKLSETPSSSFDKVYIGSQVDMHTEVLNLIDDRLLPSVTDANLKALLGVLRISVAAHLQDATTILANL